MLETGSDTVDWSGLPLACAYFGIADAESLIQRLLVIKHHRHRKQD